MAYRSSESESVLMWRRASRSKKVRSSLLLTRLPLTDMLKPNGLSVKGAVRC